MTIIKTFLIICIGSILCFSSAYAEQDIDWAVEHMPIHEAGPDTTIVGKRWKIGSIRKEVLFSLILDTQANMMRGNWYGEVRAKERFYGKIFLVDDAGNRSYLKIESAEAIGPDASYGIWNKGPATAEVQTLRFDFTRDMLMRLKNAKSLIFNYASFETPEDMSDIVFPMDSFSQALAELDTSINNAGGRAYLMTEDEIKNMPMKNLPQSIQYKLKAGVAEVSTALSIPISELMDYSMQQIKTKVEAKKSADRDAAKAAKRAEHQAIYDLEPDWLDLDLCPKPDVSYCQNVGRQAYEKDPLFNAEYDYGEILGVVWRKKGSITHIYGGSVDISIEPEIVRAKTAKYYYITQKEKGALKIRACDGMRVRG